MFSIALDRVFSRLIRRGTLTVEWPDGSVRAYPGPGNGPEAGMVLRTSNAVRRLVTNPTLACGELYMDGELDPRGCGLFELLDLLVLNLDDGGGHPVATVLDGLRRARRWMDQFNPAGRARQNVAHHYDLNGRLYSLFLDRDRQYSCAYFPTGNETLEEAQALKKLHIASKLLLRPDLEVLDIGCGWGGMALTLAQDHGVRVTGLTLSEEQHRAATERAAEARLSDRVQFLLMDYREWKRPVDRVVSVGMFEHVGIAHFGAFFRAVRGALKPDGVALIHAIGRAAGPYATNPWLAKYIFPGGYSPALSEVMPAVEKSGLWVTDIEILRLHYARTIAHWRQRFAANRDAIQSLYDERFCRMFEFYLVGCEMAFRREDHMNWQMQLSPSRDAVPLTRDYMGEAERRAGTARAEAGAAALSP